MIFDSSTLGVFEQARQQVFSAHRADPNFTGCGIGFRRRNGQLTDEPAVVAMVINKRPAGTISRERMLPEAVQAGGLACGVDVVEAGPLTFAGAAKSALRQAGGPVTGTFRPPLQGCGLSNVNGGAAGTLGCLVSDSSDGTVGVLGSSHVLARDGLAAASSRELVIQPAAADGGTEALGIGFLKRYVSFGTGANPVDAALVQLTDQIHLSQNVAGGLMAPISPSHPAVGMVVADDSGSCGRNCYLSRMDQTLSALGVTLFAGTSAVTAPAVGMHIEKAGRATGYTSSTVDAIGAQVKVVYGAKQVTLSNLIWTQAFSLPGDSGAVACKGGNGTTYAQLPEACTTPAGGGCALLDALGTYYDIPLNSSGNHTLAEDLRDGFLAQSRTGELLIGTVYLNMQVAINRLNTDTGTAHNQAAAQAKAQSLYSRYHSLAATLITSDSPTAVVTSSDLSTVEEVLIGLAYPPSIGGTGMLTQSESVAATNLYNNVLGKTLGMNRQQLIDYMNQSSVFQSVHTQIQGVGTIQATGPVSAD